MCDLRPKINIGYFLDVQDDVIISAKIDLTCHAHEIY